MENLIMEEFLKIFLHELEIHDQGRFQKMILFTNWVFSIYSCYKLLNHIINGFF